MKKIVLTGGGTAGHIMPNLALIPELKKTYDKIIYIGSENSMEKNLSKQYGLHFFEVSTIKLKRSLSLKNILIPLVLLKGYFQAKKILKQIRPNVVFSKGGYVSLPIVFAAKKLKIPVISHESDFNLGLANKLTKNISKAICTSFESTAKNLKNGIYTGSPIREQILKGNRNAITKKTNFKSNKPVLLIIGGSLGSKTINEIVFNNVNVLLNNFNIIHIVGKNNINKNIKNENYFQIEFSNEIENYLDYADYVISRAGSNAICELLTLQKPMLLIPLSKKASRGDQILNAEYFAKKNYALVLLEENLNITNLERTLIELKIKKNYFIENMKKNQNSSSSNKKIVDIINKYAKF